MDLAGYNLHTFLINLIILHCNECECMIYQIIIFSLNQGKQKNIVGRDSKEFIPVSKIYNILQFEENDQSSQW